SLPSDFWWWRWKMSPPSKMVWEAPMSCYRRRGLDAARDMGLCFVASVGARRWVGRELRTPRFGAHDLDAGLSSWRRLREARARLKAGEAEHAASAAWRRLREVYLDIWAEA
ncbi:unnamed protein product, partial [Prorocentrum cordatum]